ncbi:hypothetical protein CVT24_007707 [Panaeolus cyanescens]|uniref:Uncharacterized protein n=1 Tax=Panaeolus cyanescens TaxID=181874 RepID=A0A409YKT5_9AGAR|nr:hypothetical protein CVT24_007707 [Panaeolus cyanescens]
MSSELAVPTQDYGSSDMFSLLNHLLAHLQTLVQPVPTFSGNIDPELHDVSASTRQVLPAALPFPHIVPAIFHGTEKRQRRGRNMTRRGVVPGACTNCMCKRCCESEQAVCLFKNHNGGKMPVTSSQNSAHLPRPLPAAPYLVSAVLSDAGPQARTIPTATATPLEPVIPSNRQGDTSITVTTPLQRPQSIQSASIPPGSFSFKKPVPADLKEGYVRQCREQDKRREIESLKARHQVKIKQSVTPFAYLDDDELPIMRPLQGIISWPSLNFYEIHSDLAVLFGLPLSTILDLEVLIAVNGVKAWIPVTLDFSMSVSTNDSLYLRKQGCSSGPAVAPHILYAGTTAPRKRRIPDSLDSPTTDRPSKLSRLHTPYSSLPSSPSPPSPVLSTPVKILGHISSHISSPTAEPYDDRGDLWAQGYVTTPVESHLKWPHGTYVRDMAEGFDMLAAGRVTVATLLDRFPVVFRGMLWVSATYQKNRKFWMELAPEVRHVARNLPRINEGLWEIWRKTQSSWR